MRISYLMNSYVFMEVYNIVKDGAIKTEEVKINSILKYLKNEEKEKVYENVKSLTTVLEDIKIENNIDKDFFKCISVKQVGTYPIEAFSIDVCEDLDLSIDVIEKIKSVVFLCCSNISLIINKNSLDIEKEIEEIMIGIKKFYSEAGPNEDKLVDIMIRSDENAIDDFALSVSVDESILEGSMDEMPNDVIAFEVTNMLDELSDYINNDVVSLLVDDESIIRIVKIDGNVTFRYNKAIVNELPENIELSIKDKSKQLLELLSN